MGSEEAGGQPGREGVSFADAATAFGHPLSLTIDDPDHSVGEERFVLDGSTSSGRVVVVEGGYGFFSSGVLTLRDAVIARQADAAGGVPTEIARAALALERVAYVDNATDQVRVDPALPESSALAPPTSVCAGPDCPAP